MSLNNDLISKSALLELAHNHVGGTVDCNDIARFPAVDAEVVRHGRWEWNLPLDKLVSSYRCTACEFLGYGNRIDKFNYCPNCGARMDGDADGD